MKKTLLFIGLLATCSIFVQGQQVIGEFPHMDGGIEGQTPKVDASSTRTATTWSISGNANAIIKNITENATNARTGTKYLEMQMATTTDNCRFNSPTATNPATGYILNNTEYTVQYFYKAASDLGTDLTGGVYIQSTTSPTSSTNVVTSTFVANTWVKAYATVTSVATTPTQTFAVIRTVGTGTTGTPASGPGNTYAIYDDFVLYAGAYDDVAPSIATAGTYNTSGTIGWTAPAGGVDGGGYVVVKYAAMPAANDDPNQNGIYQVGNTVAGSISGTVAYIGTAATFNDTYVAGTYYKIYAVDKAFNYSDELVVSDASLGVAKNQIEGLKIYPNPAKDYIAIESNKVKISSVAMYNVIGAKVISEKVLVNNRLDVSGLAKGIYMLKINAESGSATKKIVIE